MFNIYDITLKESFLSFILLVAIFFLAVLFISVIKNRNKIDFYSLIATHEGQISKCGIAFIFLLILLVYQVVADIEISGYLVELLGITFAAEIGNKYVEKKFISKSDMLNISNQLKNVDSKKKTAPAKNLDNIDFDKL